MKSLLICLGTVAIAIVAAYSNRIEVPAWQLGKNTQLPTASVCAPPASPNPTPPID